MKKYTKEQFLLAAQMGEVSMIDARHIVSLLDEVVSQQNKISTKPKGNVTIGIDFDGTCVTHDFPAVGKEIGAVSVLKKLVQNGHKLILFTMRSDILNPISKDNNILANGGNYLSDAVKWFEKNEIPLYGIQTNPTQNSWTHSPKAYAQIYIDDCGLGCPLIDDKSIHIRPFVDWQMVEEQLVEKGLI